MTTRKLYPSDVSDEEWAFVAPYLALVREDAPQRNHDLREVFNGLRWIMRTGSAWRYMPHDLPPWEAVYQQTRRWLEAGVFEEMVHDLRVLLRLSEGKAPDPRATILDSRTLQSTPESGSRGGYEGTRGGGYLGTLARLACDTSQRAGARVCGRVGRDCARGHGRVGGTGIRGPRIYRREASYGSGDSWHEVGSGQVRRGEAGLRAATAPLGRGAGFRMGIAVSTANEGLREAACHFGGAALCRLRLPLPPASDRHPRRGFITPSRATETRVEKSSRYLSDGFFGIF